MRVSFTVTADGQGRLVLEIRPRGLALGLGLHFLGAIILVLVWSLRPHAADQLAPDSGIQAKPGYV